ncbi:MAG: hypothetical protein WC457_01480 [Patescibacteria group bacterium]
MKKINWTRVIFIVGVIALLIGAIDPLEGSVIIVAGSALIALATYLARDRYWKIFFASFVLIIMGVALMFYMSSLGGFGGESTLSWGWAALMIPYPIGWLMTIITLIVKAVKKQ